VVQESRNVKGVEQRGTIKGVQQSIIKEAEARAAVAAAGAGDCEAPVRADGVAIASEEAFLGRVRDEVRRALDEHLCGTAVADGEQRGCAEAAEKRVGAEARAAGEAGASGAEAPAAITAQPVVPAASGSREEYGMRRQDNTAGAQALGYEVSQLQASSLAVNGPAVAVNGPAAPSHQAAAGAGTPPHLPAWNVFIPRVCNDAAGGPQRSLEQTADIATLQHASAVEATQARVASGAAAAAGTAAGAAASGVEGGAVGIISAAKTAPAPATVEVNAVAAKAAASSVAREGASRSSRQAASAHAVLAAAAARREYQARRRQLEGEAPVVTAEARVSDARAAVRPAEGGSPEREGGGAQSNARVTIKPVEEGSSPAVAHSPGREEGRQGQARWGGESSALGGDGKAARLFPNPEPARRDFLAPARPSGGGSPLRTGSRSPGPLAVCLSSDSDGGGSPPRYTRRHVAAEAEARAAVAAKRAAEARAEEAERRAEEARCQAVQQSRRAAAAEEERDESVEALRAAVSGRQTGRHAWGEVESERGRDVVGGPWGAAWPGAEGGPPRGIREWPQAPVQHPEGPPQVSSQAWFTAARRGDDAPPPELPHKSLNQCSKRTTHSPPWYPFQGGYSPAEAKCGADAAPDLLQPDIRNKYTEGTSHCQAWSPIQASEARHGADAVPSLLQPEVRVRYTEDTSHCQAWSPIQASEARHGADAVPSLLQPEVRVRYTEGTSHCQAWSPIQASEARHGADAVPSLLQPEVRVRYTEGTSHCQAWSPIQASEAGLGADAALAELRLLASPHGLAAAADGAAAHVRRAWQGTEAEGKGDGGAKTLFGGVGGQALFDGVGEGAGLGAGGAGVRVAGQGPVGLPVLWVPPPSPFDPHWLARHAADAAALYARSEALRRVSLRFPPAATPPACETALRAWDEQRVGSMYGEAGGRAAGGGGLGLAHVAEVDLLTSADGAASLHTSLHAELRAQKAQMRAAISRLTGAVNPAAAGAATSLPPFASGWQGTSPQARQPSLLPSTWGLQGVLPHAKPHPFPSTAFGLEGATPQAKPCSLPPTVCGLQAASRFASPPHSVTAASLRAAAAALRAACESSIPAARSNRPAAPYHTARLGASVTCHDVAPQHARPAHSPPSHAYPPYAPLAYAPAPHAAQLHAPPLHAQPPHTTPSASPACPPSVSLGEAQLGQRVNTVESPLQTIQRGGAGQPLLETIQRGRAEQLGRLAPQPTFGGGLNPIHPPSASLPGAPAPSAAGPQDQELQGVLRQLKASRAAALQEMQASQERAWQREREQMAGIMGDLREWKRGQSCRASHPPLALAASLAHALNASAAPPPAPHTTPHGTPPPPLPEPRTAPPPVPPAAPQDSAALLSADINDSVARPASCAADASRRPSTPPQATPVRSSARRGVVSALAAPPEGPGLRDLQRELESLKSSLSVYLGPGVAATTPGRGRRSGQVGAA
jgi:hypothetical protein